METITNMFDSSQGLTDEEIKNFLHVNNIPFHEIKQLKDLDKMKNAQSVVYTGSQSDEINNGNTKHWLYAVKPNKDVTYLFDSYGDKTAYNPEFFSKNNIKFINKRKLQEFGSNVCGPYVCAFAQQVNAMGNQFEPSKTINDFYHTFRFTKNARENDETIKKFWNTTVQKRF